MIRVIALCALFLVAGLGPLVAAETARVRVGAHEPPGKDAYGRIVLEWPAPVTYKAAIESGRLVVRFARPVTARLDMVTRYLDDYVSDAVIEDEGRTVAFGLKGDFGLRTYAEGAVIVLDLTRAATGASDSPKPSPAEKSASSAPKSQGASAPAAGVPMLAVRSGEHTGFGRLVFDWTRNVEYTVAHEGNRVTVRFNQPAKIDYAGLAARLPKPVSSVEPAAADGGVGVLLTLDADSRLRHFRSGTRVVLDVLDPAGAASAKANSGASKTATDNSRTAKTAPANRDQSETAKAPAQRSVAENASGSQPSSIPPKAAAPAVVAPENLLARRLGVSMQEAAPAAAPTSPSLDEVLAGIPALAVAPAAGPPASRDTAAPVPPTTPARAAPSVVSDAPTQQTSGTNPPNAEIAPLRLVVQPMGTVNELTGLRFAWPQEVGAAIYERSGFLWLIFDRRAGVEVIGAWPRGVLKPQTVTSMTPGDVTILRWSVPQGKHPGLRRDGKDWVIDLKKEQSKPVTDIKPETHVAVAAGARLLLRGNTFGAVREWRDPEVGDRVWVVPIANPGHGSAIERRLAEVQFIATLQGVVILPFSDDITVRNVPDGVEVTMPGGLHLSGNGVLMAQSSGQTPISALATTAHKLFDFAAWKTPKNINFFDRKSDLLRAVIDASGPSRNAARLAFAQFYFAHGYISDALGILQVIEEDDANAVKDPAFRALRGASRFLRGDYPAAGTDLFHTMLDSERDTALWRGVLLASQNDWTAASQYFNQSDRVLRDYPMDLQLRFGLLAAESALMTGDTGLAKFQIDNMVRLKPDRAWRDQIDYLQGRVLAKMNDTDGAVGAWERAMAGVHRPSKVKARYARAETLLADKRMTPTEAIGEVEKLRYAWRGDEIEMKVLKLLGELYIDMADYRNGLTTLREAVTYFPQSSDAPGIGDKMRAAFAALYVNGEADKLAPLSALSLYDDFRDLTPAGDAGDAVASNLVDRLVGVELLERAAAVLKSQIDTRLKGAALADAINRLGVIHLLARQPEDALAVLNHRVPPGATPTAVNQRRQLLARTFGELTRYKEALALLEGDTSPDAERLRAEIGWRTQNWPLATVALAKLVPRANQSFADADRQTVLRLAIAQALSNNVAGLKELRKSYGPAMAQSAFKESFDLVTAPGAGPTIDLRAITRQVAEVDQFRAFITSYREQLLTRKDKPVKPVSASES